VSLREEVVVRRRNLFLRCRQPPSNIGAASACLFVSQAGATRRETSPAIWLAAAPPLRAPAARFGRTSLRTRKQAQGPPPTASYPSAPHPRRAGGLRVSARCTVAQASEALFIEHVAGVCKRLWISSASGARRCRVILRNRRIGLAGSPNRQRLSAKAGRPAYYRRGEGILRLADTRSLCRGRA
jgi:hypothetical protein